MCIRDSHDPFDDILLAYQVEDDDGHHSDDDTGHHRAHLYAATVSYTHLDVYKRQYPHRAGGSGLSGEAVRAAVKGRP